MISLTDSLSVCVTRMFPLGQFVVALLKMSFVYHSLRQTIQEITILLLLNDKYNTKRSMICLWVYVEGYIKSQMHFCSYFSQIKLKNSWVKRANSKQEREREREERKKKK